MNELLSPVLFVGHGSPMNAVESNAFTRMLDATGVSISKPKAILCVTAHWMTKGTVVGAMKNPRTIHDFYGFPKELFSIQYPAQGLPALAEEINRRMPEVALDQDKWGYDHGIWSILLHLYPKANIPVVPLSIAMDQGPTYHFRLGQKLQWLRQQGVLIVGSGNIVHNLSRIDWNPQAQAASWAMRFHESMKALLHSKKYSDIAEYSLSGEDGRMSHPTPDHFYPFLTALGAMTPEEEIEILFDEIHHGSISMLSFVSRSNGQVISLK